MKYIIRPFAEIIVKSKPVRKRYLDFLQNNTNLALKKIDESLKAKLFWDKLELSVPLSPALPPSQGGREQKGEIIKVLSRVP
jgi:thiamine biosynthesis protein ThiI